MVVEGTDKESPEIAVVLTDIETRVYRRVRHKECVKCKRILEFIEVQSKKPKGHVTALFVTKCVPHSSHASILQTFSLSKL